MVPPEVFRSVDVIADIVNQMLVSPDGITQDWVRGLMRRYGMSYSSPVTVQDCREIEKIAEKFKAIFDLREKELAAFANKTVEGIRFSPEVVNHGGYGWHIHYYGEDFPIAKRIRTTSAMAIMSLIIHGETGRMKVCAAKDCEKVFIDKTRNASKVFCSVQTCGNRTHVSNHRAKISQTA